MNSYLCLGNAQALILKDVKNGKAALALQSRIAKQASAFFESAFELCQTTKALMNFDGGQFANHLGFWSRYYLA